MTSTDPLVLEGLIATNPELLETATIEHIRRTLRAAQHRGTPQAHDHLRLLGRSGKVGLDQAIADYVADRHRRASASVTSEQPSTASREQQERLAKMSASIGHFARVTQSDWADDTETDTAQVLLSRARDARRVGRCGKAYRSYLQAYERLHAQGLDGILLKGEIGEFLCAELDAPEQARDWLEQSLFAATESYGPSDARTGVAHRRLATMHRLNGDLAAAAREYEICRKLNATSHSAASFRLLIEGAEIALAIDDRPKALELASRALESARPGDDPRQLAIGHGLLGRTLDGRDDESAYRHYLDAVKARRQLAPTGHPSDAALLARAAAIAVRTGRPEDSLPVLREANAVDMAHLPETLAFGDYAWRERRMRDVRRRFTMLLTLVTQYLDLEAIDQADLASLAAELAVSNSERFKLTNIKTQLYYMLARRKAVEIEVEREVRRSLAGVAGEAAEGAAALVQDLARLRQKIAGLSLGAFRNSAEAKAKLSDHIAEESALQHRLMPLVPVSVFETYLYHGNSVSIAMHLPADSALVDYIRVDCDCLPGPEGTKLGHHYYAMVLRAGKMQAEVIDLDDADAIDEAISAFLDQVRADRRTGARQRGSREAVRESVRYGDLVREKVLDPVMPALAGVTRLVVCPDARIFELPFDALPLGDGHVLDRYSISYVSAPRDVISFGSEAGADIGGPPLVVGNPDFDLRPRADNSVGAEAVDAVDAPGGPFVPLPGTQAEAVAVATLLGTEPLTGARATAAAIRDAPSPRILHIATHAFFSRARPGDGALLAGLPLLRCGLALAGANRDIEAGVQSDTGAGSLLTGYDFLSMDLGKTQLVVLSACETGVGESTEWDGLFGLSRAIQSAGAWCSVTTLWKVSDTATKDFMTSMYGYLSAGLAVHDAVRKAKTDLRETGLPAFYWAPFHQFGLPIPIEMPRP